MTDLQIVLKAAERCNINCSYCYYFNAGNTAPMARAPFVSDDTARGIVHFVQQTAGRMTLGHLRVVLHGGEPLMLKKSRFRRICNILRELKTTVPRMSIVTTSNGMLIDDEWIELFEEFNIGVCVSVDGPRAYHDLERVDFKGRGTYEKVIAGIDKLKRASAAGRIIEPSVLTVINPNFRGNVVYDHIVRKLGIRLADFRVPMTIHDAHPRAADIESIGCFLADAFTEWVKDDDPGIRIRIFNTYLSRLLDPGSGYARTPSYIIVAVGSDGTILNDDLMQILGQQIFDRNLNIRLNSMEDYLEEVTRGELGGIATPYDECQRCEWFNVCQPAHLPWNGAEMRYKRSTGFQNRLVHCDAFQKLFLQMRSYLQNNELPSPRVGLVA